MAAIDGPDHIAHHAAAHSQTVVASIIGQVLPAGASVPTTQTVVNTGYELEMDCIAETVGATSQTEVLLQFTDSNTSLIVGQRRYTFWPAAQGSPSVQHVTGMGPTRGDTITVTVTNHSAVAAIGVNLVVTQSGRYHERDWFSATDFPASASGNTVPTSDQPSGILAANFYSAVASGATKTDQLPPYRGRIHVHWDSSSAAADCELTISALDDPTVTLATGAIFDQFTNSTGNADQELALPGAQCFLNIENHNAAAKNLRYLVLAIDY